MTKKPWIERVNNKTDVRDGCWLFTGGSSGPNKMYGALRNDEGVMENTHVTAFKHFKGEVPVGHVVRHTCHNGKCWNPDHLISGTQKQNMEDKVLANRDYHSLGEQHHMSKITDAQALEIIQKYKIGGVLQRELADEYGISQTAVSQLVRYKTRRRRLQLST